MRVKEEGMNRNSEYLRVTVTKMVNMVMASVDMLYADVLSASGLHQVEEIA